MIFVMVEILHDRDLAVALLGRQLSQRAWRKQRSVDVHEDEGQEPERRGCWSGSVILYHEVVDEEQTAWLEALERACQ
jgi:hypothetical protein